MNRDSFTVLFIACPRATRQPLLAKQGRRLVQERRRQKERRKAAGKGSGRDTGRLDSSFVRQAPSGSTLLMIAKLFTATFKKFSVVFF